MLAGPVSPTSGDFVALLDNTTWPTKGLIGDPAKPAVIFNNSIDGVADRLFCNHSSFPLSNSFWGQSDW